MDAEVVKIFVGRMKRRGKNAIQHRTQSYSMFWRGRGWNGIFWYFYGGDSRTSTPMGSQDFGKLITEQLKGPKVVQNRRVSNNGWRNGLCHYVFFCFSMIRMFPKIVVPQIIHFNRVFLHKPSILGAHLFLETSIRSPKVIGSCGTSLDKKRVHPVVKVVALL